jgi:hypothetical protein
MVDEKKYHRINDYLSGELQGTALDKFRIDLKNSTELQEAVALQEAIIGAINQHREAELRAFISKKNKAKSTSGTKVIVLQKGVKLALASAAAVALLVAGYFTIAPYNQDLKMDTVFKKDTKENSNSEGLKRNDSDDQVSETQTLAISEDKPTEEISEQETNESPSLEKEEETTEDDYSDDAPLKEDADLAEELDGIKTDKLLSNRNYTVSRVSPTFSAVTETTSSVKDAKEKAKPQNDAKVTEEKVAASDNKKVVTKTVSVEYWKSVVNFKGYKYDGNKVQLYGISESKPLVFKELDDRLYVRIDGKQYYIEPNSTHKRLTEVTNTTLLNVLND